MITVEQDLTIYTAAELKEFLFDRYESLDEVVLDLSKVAEMDTAGLQLLLVSKKTLEAKNKTLTIKNNSEAVEEVLSTYGLSNYFN